MWHDAANFDLLTWSIARGNSIQYPLQSSFVGRERELAELDAGLQDARLGRGRFFVLTGDPGIGKSRLADEVAAEAVKSGWSVLRGRCWEEGNAPAYWPFVQMIRAALRDSSYDGQTSKSNTTQTPPLPHEIAQLVPDLLPPAAQPDASQQPPVNAEEARFRLFDAVARLLRELARLKPLLLIVEDLHDADQPSLLMLRLVVRELRDAPVLIIGTYREIEVRRPPELSRLIGELTREGTHIPLFALSREEAARMIEARKGEPAIPRLVSEIYQATAGNPLFINGLVRVLIAEDRLSAATRLDLTAFRVPDGVREAIRQWLTFVSDRPVLRVAAIIGQEFDLTCLQHVTQISRDQLLDLMREACGAGILVQVSRDVCRFSHALIRGTLCDELSSAASRELHLKIGEALEELYQADISSHAAELAHHFREGGELNKATDYFVSAGEAALAVFAYEQTATHWLAALKVMPVSSAYPVRRANLLDRFSDLPALDVAQGSERIRLLEQALELYQELGWAQAIGLTHMRLAFWNAVAPDAHVSRESHHSMKAREFLNQEPTPLSSIMLHLHLAVDAVRQMRFEETLTEAQQGIELGERAGDEFFKERAGGTQAAALGYLGRLGASSGLFDKMWLESGRLNDVIGTWVDTITAAHQLLMLLDPAAAASWVNRERSKPWLAQNSFVEESLLEHLGLAQALMGNLTQARGFVAKTAAQPLFGGYSLEEYLAFYVGDWAAVQLLLAKSLNDEVYAHAPLQFCVRSPLAARLLRLQDRQSEAVALLEKTLSIRPMGPGALIEMVARQELALDFIDSGRLTEAQKHFTRCREIMADGEDWRGLVGTLARVEGALAAAQGRFQEANDRFAESAEVCRRYQVPFEEAETLRYWSRSVLAAGDRRTAIAKLEAAAERYGHHGAGKHWHDGIEADRLRAEGAGACFSGVLSKQHGIAEQDSPLNGVFRNEGEYWTLVWEGCESRLKARLGFRYIASLLRHPGNEIAAWDLVAQVVSGGLPERDNDAGRNHSHSRQVTIARGLGDAGEALDPQARAKYRTRLKELREERELASQLNDPSRADRARQEIEFIEDEIAAAVGLGGRSRKSGSHTERARLAVTKTVRAALARIRQADPELGRHLTNSIRTGNFCAYLPGRPVTWLL